MTKTTTTTDTNETQNTHTSNGHSITDTYHNTVGLQPTLGTPTVNSGNEHLDVISVNAQQVHKQDR